MGEKYSFGRAGIDMVEFAYRREPARTRSIQRRLAQNREQEDFFNFEISKTNPFGSQENVEANESRF